MRSILFIYELSPRPCGEVLITYRVYILTELYRIVINTQKNDKDMTKKIML